MGNACRLLSKIWWGFGAICSFYFSSILGIEIDWGLYKERDWVLTIAIFLGAMLFVTVVSVALYTLGDIYDKVYYSNVDSIELSPQVAQKLAALIHEEETKKILANGGWECPDCGEINRSYLTTCKCGKGKNN